MGRYFLCDIEVTESDAALAWFSYAGDHDIDISEAIGIWDDAATQEGANSRDTVGLAGIRVELRIGPRALP